MKTINNMDTAHGNPKSAYVYSGFLGSNHNRLWSEKIEKKKPYNTGKVLIGIDYDPPQKHEVSLDAERLQEALIGGLHSREERAERIFLSCLAVIGLFGLIIIVATR